MRKLLFIIVLFFPISVLAEEKCNLIEEIFTDKCKVEKLGGGLPLLKSQNQIKEFLLIVKLLTSKKI